MSRFRPAKPFLPPRTRQVAVDVQDAETIARLLMGGAVETPLGGNTILRVNENRAATFRTELVTEVKRRMREAGEW